MREVKQAEFKLTFAQRIGRAIDSAISVVAPDWGLTRFLSRAKQQVISQRVAENVARRAGGSGWDGAKNNRTRGETWLASEAAPNVDIEDDWADLLFRCMDLYKNNTLAHSAVEARVSHEIGTGIHPQSRVKAATNLSTEGQAERIRVALEDAFVQWSKKGVNTRRDMSIVDVQKLIVRCMGYAGEAFILLGNSMGVDDVTMSVDVIDPARVMTPPELMQDPLVRMGVQFNAAGVVVGYHVRTTHPTDISPYYEYRWDYYDRWEPNGQPRMLHIFEKIFASQVRGVPWLANGGAMNRCKDVDDFWEAELIAKQVEACFGIIVTKSSEGLSPQEVAEKNTTEKKDNQKIEDIAPGMIQYANENEDVKVVDPDRPGSNFTPFTEASIRTYAGALNMPYESIAKNFFRTTFSSGQLAMLDGDRGFSMRRNLVKERGLCPIWNRFVYEYVFANASEGEIDLLRYRDNPDHFNRHEWHGPGRGFINPRDDMRARAQALDYDMTTLTDIYAEQGQDAEDKLRKRFEEKKRLIEADVELRAYQWELEEKAGIPHQEQEQTESATDQESQREQNQEANA